MRAAGVIHAAGRRERSCCGVVQLRASQREIGGVEAPCDQNYSIVEQRRAMRKTSGVQAPGGREVLVVGSYSSALARNVLPLPMPPAISTFPLFSSVAV